MIKYFEDLGLDDLADLRFALGIAYKYCPDVLPLKTFQALYHKIGGGCFYRYVRDDEKQD